MESKTVDQQENWENLNNPLVEIPPSPSMELCVVVPLCAEYKNGNVFRLIESFTKQTVPPEQFEILFLVNNTISDIRLGTSNYRDNQLTLCLGEYLNQVEVELPDNLNEYRRSVLEKAKEKGLKIHMVDFSTAGITRNIGRIRDIGLSEAIRRFNINGKGGDGLVAQLDTDTVVEPLYIKKLLERFSNPELESLFLGLEYFVPEGNEELFRTSFYHQYSIAMEQWVNTLFNTAVEVGGPQTVARVRGYQKVGGIVHQQMGEDFALATELSTKTRCSFAPDIRVYTSDRAREEGYDASTRLATLTSGQKSVYSGDVGYIRPRIKFLEQELIVVARSQPNIFSSEQSLRAHFDKYKLPFDYSEFRKIVLNEAHLTLGGKKMALDLKVGLFTESYLKNMGVETAAKGSVEYAEDAIEIFRMFFPDGEIVRLHEILRQVILRDTVRLEQSRSMVKEALGLIYEKGTISIDDFKQSLKTYEFMERNPWILVKLKLLHRAHPSQEEALIELKNEFPEWLESFEKSRLRKGTALLRGLTNFMREVRNEPTKYPMASKFLNSLQTQPLK